MKHYLCKSRASFAISVPILPAPSTVPVHSPGTLTQDSKQQKENSIEDLKKDISLVDIFLSNISIFKRNRLAAS